MPNNNDIVKWVIWGIIIISIVVVIPVTIIVSITADKLESIHIVEIALGLTGFLGLNSAIGLLIKRAVTSKERCSRDGILECCKNDTTMLEDVYTLLKKRVEPDDVTTGGVIGVIDTEE